MGLSINIAGTWKDTTTNYINVAGTWKEANLYVNVAGVWKAMSSPQLPTPTLSVVWNSTSLCYNFACTNYTGDMTGLLQVRYGNQTKLYTENSSVEIRTLPANVWNTINEALSSYMVIGDWNVNLGSLVDAECTVTYSKYGYQSSILNYYGGLVTGLLYNCACG